MCGLFGFSVVEPIPFLGSLLGICNDRRGGHGWGYAVVESENRIRVNKGLGKFSSHRKDPFSRMQTVIGHTRFATTGAKVLENAHPFEIGPIIGAHNGMIWNHDILSQEYEREYEVDSMHLFAHLAENLPFDDIEGYGAISWHDSRDEKVRLCRMHSGELAIRRLMRGEKTLGVAWSSLDTDLLWALKRVGIEESIPYRVDEGEVYLVRQDGLFISGEQALVLSEGWESRWTSGRLGGLTQSEFNLLEEESWEIENKELDFSDGDYYPGRNGKYVTRKYH